MKTRLFSFAGAILLFVASSCQKADTTPIARINQETNNQNSGKKANFSANCEATNAILVSEAGYESGTLSVKNDAAGDAIMVTYVAETGWYIAQTALYAGDCDLIPIGWDGTPELSLYPFKTIHANVSSFIYNVPVSMIPIGSYGCISAQVRLLQIDDGGQVLDEKIAWAVNKNPIFGNQDYGISFKYFSCQ